MEKSFALLLILNFAHNVIAMDPTLMQSDDWCKQHIEYTNERVEGDETIIRGIVRVNPEGNLECEIRRNNITNTHTGSYINKNFKPAEEFQKTIGSSVPPAKIGDYYRLFLSDRNNKAALRKWSAEMTSEQHRTHIYKQAPSDSAYNKKQSE